ncbi:hypothetical protein SDRG_16511 [Saprolegnia diclina VS20]|uniref:Ion transport domain-containing protein n=1 Tax=Saprolegnia diclina (strain VS20) TaxID=1156394 RepID=T0PX62_SAPDV|nr:hypothetical protein SDRG_16511 [Saprolegnia diclina VS20]EQC25615.1 hypothetical protein SDRG_16511 [Saprolegnia diclina VS20]|eukprot:XP_008620947.1 hypothetical protein SDRG_16511 [Saprolegnia diclina VS20]
MHYISDVADGTAYPSYHHQDSIGVMVEMTPSEPSTTYMASRTPRSESGHSNYDEQHDVAKPLPPNRRFSQDYDANRSTFRHTRSLAREAAKAQKLRELETISSDLDDWKDNVAQMAGAFRAKVRDSMLFKLLHQDAPDAFSPFDLDAIDDAKKRLLQHPVMRLMVLLKWRAFGLRMYCEQLLMHWLLLLTFTVSLAIGFGIATSAKLDQVLVGWLVGMPFLLVSLLATRFSTWKNKVVCACVVFVLVSGAITGLLLKYDKVKALCNSTAPIDEIWDEDGKDGINKSFVSLNNAVLGLSALYFCLFESREFAADMPDDDVRRGILGRWLRASRYMLTSLVDLVCGKPTSPYLESYWNRIQLPTFFFVFVYVFCEFASPFSANMRVYGGIPALFLLWIMGVSYLEVFPAVGYLLPMMRRMLADVFRYLAFYFPIQCAYTCAYYLLFKSQGYDLKPYEPDQKFIDKFNESLSVLFPGANTTDETLVTSLLEILKTKDKNDMFQGYETVPKSFLTTYLVTFGQINLEPFDQLATTSASILGYLLVLTHATIVIVMLLNVLIAMMDKTMGAYMDEAKVEATVTFAECVLRMEKTTTQAMSEVYWRQLDKSKAQVLYENMLRADANEKSEDSAVLHAIAKISSRVKSLQTRRK